MAYADLVGMPAAEDLPHGTRARYKRGCRCDLCRGANNRGNRERTKRAKEAVAQLEIAPAAPAPQRWKTPRGEERTRIYRRACPGINGQPCPKKRHLRMDSSPVCWSCRDLLAYRGLVDATPVRRHLRKLSKMGIGYKSAAEACDVGRTTLALIVAGAKRCRAEVARRVLAVTKDAIADSALVPAAPTWKLLNELIELGWTKTALASALGDKQRKPALQIRRTRVHAATALAVRKFHATAINEAPPPRRSRWGEHDPLRRPKGSCSCEKPLPIRGACAKCEKAIA